ncbi:unnamed protein product [Polarella glacialis]|uniref:Uncharacterized protein n=1 Tax=Polarella glacialis TaxID=89957 RepID=A0A813EPX4_POLGL|nr:unnamed protein product [Polarella glacialis]CAE8609930.1 unnamed protein product [Polarella glacialis]
MCVANIFAMSGKVSKSKGLLLQHKALVLYLWSSEFFQTPDARWRHRMSGIIRRLKSDRTNFKIKTKSVLTMKVALVVFGALPETAALTFSVKCLITIFLVRVSGNARSCFASILCGEGLVDIKCGEAGFRLAIVLGGPDLLSHSRSRG